MLKNLFIFITVIVFMMLFWGCNNAVVFPDIAGTWDWVINFTTNECEDSTTVDGYAVITQNESETDTVSGTIRIYEKIDINLTCPIWTMNYTMQENGNLTVNETLPFDSQQCASSSAPDTMGIIVMNLLATDISISGGFSINLSSAIQGWSCNQIGTITLSNKR